MDSIRQTGATIRPFFQSEKDSDTGVLVIGGFAGKDKYPATGDLKGVRK